MAVKFLAKLARYAVYVFAFAHSGVVLSLDVWCAVALAAITFRCDLLEQLRNALPGMESAFRFRRQWWS
jgi:hypothetical protein